MKGFIASSLSVLTVFGVVAVAMPVVAQQVNQHSEKSKNQHPDKSQTAAPGNVITKAVYKCDEGKSFSAIYRDDGTAETTFGSREFTLNRVESGSGARYSNGSITLFIKGDTAFVEVGDNKLFANCVATGGGVQGMW